MNRLEFSDPYVKDSKIDNFGGVEALIPEFDSPDRLPALIGDLRRRAAEVYANLSPADIRSITDTVDAFFADADSPEVRSVIDLLVETDGFSRYDIERFGIGIFAPLLRYDPALIGRFVEQAFQSRRPVETAYGYLKRFGLDLPLRRWREPSIISHFVSGNVVGYSSILLRIGFPLKNSGAAQVIKLPATSAIFPLIYLDKPKDVCPELRETIASGYWKGGDRRIEDLVLKSSNAVNVLGSDTTVRDVRERARRLSPQAVLLPHGHKIGAAYVSRNFAVDQDLREATIQSLVRDISAFDGAACYSLKNIFVQGDHRDFAERLQAALVEFADKISPVGREAGRVARNLRRIFLGSPDILTSAGAQAVVRIRDKAEFWFPDETFRYVQVMPVEDENHAAAVLEAAGPYLQTVVVAVPDDLILPVFELFGRAGASNIHFPGSAPFLNVHEEPHDGDFDVVKVRRPYRYRFAATNFKKNSDWL